MRMPVAMADSAAASGSSPLSDSDIFPNPTVSVQWLKEHLDDLDVKVIDASWYLPVEKRDPFSEFKTRRIRRSVFFDLDVVCDLSTELPHMLPTEAVFSRAVDALGIRNSDKIVVYDGRGIFSAPRLWWMFRAFGHEHVAVLEGGLPKWREEGGDVEEGDGEGEEAHLSSPLKKSGIALSEAAMTTAKSTASADMSGRGGGGEGGSGTGFATKLRPDLVRVWQDLKGNVENEGKGFQIVDARPKGRFDGTAPEPRVGVPAGHVPGSKNVPFVDVLTKFEGGCYKDEESLQKSFVAAGVLFHEPIVAMCGTGVTACILALALHKIGQTDVPVYDGSWTEWATSTEGLPITTVSVAIGGPGPA